MKSKTIFIILVISASGYHTYFYAISKGEISLTGTVIAVYPVFTIILSQVFLHERLSIFQFIGVGLVISGVVFVALPKRSAAEKTKNLGWPYGEVCDLLMGRWRDALATEGLVHLRDLETIEQHQQYVYDEHGRPCHQRLRSEKLDIREKHGDLVVGVALAYRAVIDLPLYSRVAPDRAPAGSAAGRSAKRRRLAKQKDSGGWG